MRATPLQHITPWFPWGKAYDNYKVGLYGALANWACLPLFYCPFQVKAVGSTAEGKAALAQALADEEKKRWAETGKRKPKHPNMCVCIPLCTTHHYPTTRDHAATGTESQSRGQS